MVFWKIGALVFLKQLNIPVGLGEVLAECLWRSLFLVKLQAYSLLLDRKMGSFGGVFKYFTLILGACFSYFQNSSLVVATIVCFFFFTFIFLTFSHWSCKYYETLHYIIVFINEEKIQMKKKVCILLVVHILLCLTNKLFVDVAYKHLISGTYLNKTYKSLNVRVLFLLFTIYIMHLLVRLLLSAMLKFANFVTALFFTNLTSRAFIVLLFLTHTHNTI